MRGRGELRVAFFPDAYHEVDGVANTCRHYEAFAKRKGLPFLTIIGGSKNSIQVDGSVSRLERRRGWIRFAVDKNHDFDLAFWRHYNVIETAVREFRPDVVHITGPSDVGQLGTLVAHRLKVPLAASWHTNLHQYAEQRSLRLLSFLPETLKERLGPAVRHGSLLATLRFYKIARVLFAPNQELVAMLEGGTGKRCYPMPRGVDTQLFHPHKRDRSTGDFVLGYVGRLSTEKNVRLLAEIECGLLAAGVTNFRFLVVGQGAEEAWLKENLKRADFTGVLKGEALARAYANMDLFIFPSLTDTYGNVVLEALASGVPAVVSDRGGPQFIVQPGDTGFVAKSLHEFISCIQVVAKRPEELQTLRLAARRQAENASWDRVFESIYGCYERELRTGAIESRLKARAHGTAAATRIG